MAELGPVVDAIRARRFWRDRLDNEYAAVAARLRSSYANVLPGLEAQRATFITELDRLARERRDTGTQLLTAAEVRQLDAYNSFIVSIQADMDSWAREIRDTTLREAAEVGIANGVDAARGMVGQIGAAWNQVDPEALAQQIGYLDSAAITDIWDFWGARAISNPGGVGLDDMILAFTAIGRNPREIADRISEWFDLPYTWAENHIRTLNLWSYRAASHEAYKRNSDVVRNWMWVATLDNRVCPACLSMHGTIHTHDEILNGHHRCRCTPVPIVAGSTWWRDYQTGDDWLRDQDDEMVRNILGKRGSEAWNNNEFRLPDVRGYYNHTVFGRMLRAKSWGSILGGN